MMGFRESRVKKSCLCSAIKPKHLIFTGKIMLAMKIGYCTIVEVILKSFMLINDRGNPAGNSRA